MNIDDETRALARLIAHAGFPVDGLVASVACEWRRYWLQQPCWERKRHGKPTYDRRAKLYLIWPDVARPDFRDWIECDYVCKHLYAHLAAVSDDADRAMTWCQDFAVRTAKKRAELREQCFAAMARRG